MYELVYPFFTIHYGRHQIQFWQMIPVWVFHTLYKKILEAQSVVKNTDANGIHESQDDKFDINNQIIELYKDY